MTVKISVAAVAAVTPEPILDILRSISERQTKDLWAVGDITNYLIASFREQGYEFPDAAVYRMVAQEAGVSAKRVEQLRHLAAFFSEPVRERYAVLPHSHFEFARSMGDRWQEALDVSLRKMDELGGRRPSVDWLHAYFFPTTPEPPAPAPYPEAEIAAGGAAVVADDEPWLPLADESQAGSDWQRALASVRAYHDNYRHYIVRAIEPLPVSEGVRQQLEAALAALSRALAAAAEELERQRRCKRNSLS